MWGCGCCYCHTCFVCCSLISKVPDFYSAGTDRVYGNMIPALRSLMVTYPVLSALNANITHTHTHTHTRTLRHTRRNTLASYLSSGTCVVDGNISHSQRPGQHSIFTIFFRLLDSCNEAF
jgi:hypothetical protein